MKILLVRPPTILGAVGAHALQHPIGLCYLAAALLADGCDVEILDYEVETYTEAAFEAAVAEKKPDLIGLTAMTPLIALAGRMAAAARRAAPNAKILIGGAHACARPAETIREFPVFDAAVAGEGERRIVELARAAREGRWETAEIRGAVLRNGNDVRDFSADPGEPADLDALIFPARQLLKLPLYHGAPTPGFPQSVFHATVIFTSRGCPGRCIFCCAGNVFGPRVRFRSTENIIAEITECRDRFGFRHFTIDDDTFTLRREHVMAFCEAVAPLGVTWDCDTRVDHVDQEVIRTMARSGCLKLAFGIESGSPEILEKIKKGITIPQVREAFRLTREVGILTCGFFMVGSHPDETAAHIDETRRLIRDIDPDLISVAIASPYPKTELHEILSREGLLPEGLTWEDYGRSFIGRTFTRTRTLGPDDLQRAQQQLLRAHYLRPSYILRRLLRLRSPADARYWFAAGFQFLRYIGRRNRSVQPGE